MGGASSYADSMAVAGTPDVVAETYRLRDSFAVGKRLGKPVLFLVVNLAQHILAVRARHDAAVEQRDIGNP